VDDVVQDVFLLMQRGLAGLRDEERFGAWVYQVARTAIVDHQRRAAKHRVAERGVLREEAPEIEQDDRAVERELAGYVAPFVAILPS
jgi:RNA polymerase sigma-70 factor, ECF subfamily